MSDISHSQVEQLVETWLREAADYPVDDLRAVGAQAAVRLCAKELEAALQADRAGTRHDCEAWREEGLPCRHCHPMAGYAAELAALRAKIEVLKTEHTTQGQADRAGTWQPIATAPKDGQEILGWLPHFGVERMHWNDDQHAKCPRPFWDVVGFVFGMTALRSHQPTHWQPRPPAPPTTGDAA